MAFQMDVPDIQVHNPSPTHQVEVSTAQAIEAVGGLAGEAIKGHQLSKATDSISALHEEVTTLNAVIEAGQRSGRSVFDPQGNVSTEGLPDDLAAQIRKVQERAGSRFKVLANAVAQGATTQDAAALQAEATIRELTNQTPGFSKEIREMARQLLGYDPHGFAIRQVLNINQPARQKTDAEKAWEQAVADSDALRMIGIDMPPQTIYGNRALQKVQETNKSLADAALEMNNIDFTEWFQQTVMAPGVDIATTLSAVAQMRAEQGGIASEEQYIDAIIRQREAEKIDVRRKAAQYPGGVSNVDLARMEEMVDSKYAPIVQAFERNALGAIMARDLKVMAMINEKWGRQAAPTITRILDAFPTVASEIFNLLVNISDPKQIQLMYPKGSPVREILEAYNFDFDTGAFRETFVDTLTNVGQGQPLTEKEQEFLPVVEQAVIQPVPGREKVREEFVKGLAAAGAPVRAVSLLGTQVPMIKATEQEVDFFTRQYKRHVGEPGQEDTPGNLIAMVADEYMNLDEGLITQPLHLVTKETDQTLRRRLMGLPPRQREIPPKLSVRGIFYGGIESEHATPAMKKLQVYIDAVYKNGWGEAIGADKETFAQSLIDRINRVIEARQEKAEKEAEKRVGQPTPMRWSNRPSPQLQRRQLNTDMVIEPEEEYNPERTMEFIKKKEGLLLSAKDEGNGRYSIGYGRDNPTVTPDMKITREQAEEMLREDIEIAEADVDALVKVPITPYERMALVSLVYNVGRTALANSKALAALNAGDRETFMREAFDPKIGFVKSGGKVLPGLVKRRAEERKIFEGGA